MKNTLLLLLSLTICALLTTCWLQRQDIYDLKEQAKSDSAHIKHAFENGFKIGVLTCDTAVKELWISKRDYRLYELKVMVRAEIYNIELK